MKKGIVAILVGLMCLTGCESASMIGSGGTLDSEIEMRVSEENETTDDNINVDDISHIYRSCQFGVNSPDAELYDLCVSEFLLINETTGVKYAVDFSYKLDNGVGSGALTIDKVDGFNVYTLEEDLHDLEKDNNILDTISDGCMEDDYLNLYLVIDSYFTSRSEDVIADVVTVEDIEYLYSEEGLQEAMDNMICYD